MTLTFYEPDSSAPKSAIELLRAQVHADQQAEIARLRLVNEWMRREIETRDNKEAVYMQKGAAA